MGLIYKNKYTYKHTVHIRKHTYAGLFVQVSVYPSQWFYHQIWAQTAVHICEQDRKGSNSESLPLRASLKFWNKRTLRFGIP